MPIRLYDRSWCFHFCFLWLCFGVLLSPLWGGAAFGQRMRHFTEHREFLGWSKDGRYAVFYDPLFNPDETGTKSTFKDGGEGGDDCIIHLAWVLDTRRGSLTRYLVDSSVATLVHNYYEEGMDRWSMQVPIACVFPEEDGFMGRSEGAAVQRAKHLKLVEKYRKLFARVPSPAALRALLQGPVRRDLPSKSSPDGALRLDVEITSKRPIRKKWDGPTLQLSGRSSGDGPTIADVLARFSIKRREQATASIAVPIPDDKLFGNAWIHFTPVWAPDGRHLALLFSTNVNIKRDVVEESTAIIPTLGPKIALECTSEQLARAQEIFGDALYRAGHSLLSAEAVQRKQLVEQTRILALDGYEAAAQSVAAALPGGAEVRKQTARTSYHLIIQVGGSVSLQAPSPVK